MKGWQWIVALSCVMLGVGCSQESADELFARGEAATHRVESYSEAEAHLGKFLKLYPEDPRTDVALQALARVLLSQQKSPEAIGRYSELVARFPKSRYADQAQFMIGYVYDQEGDLEKAQEAYQKVLDLYPDSELRDDAEASIANLGKSPDAWLPPDAPAEGGQGR